MAQVKCVAKLPCCLVLLLLLVVTMSGAAVAALQLENSKLREEVDSLKQRLPTLGLLRRTSSNVQLAGAATEQLMAELAQVSCCAVALSP